MLNLTREATVHAPPAQLWETAQDLVRNPLRYMPLATAAEVTPVTGGFDSRIDVFGFTLRERVTLHEMDRTATYDLEKNPDWSGTREVRVGGGPKRDERLPTTSLSITFTWIALSPRARDVDAAGMERLVQAALERLKEFAEAKAKGR